MLVNVLGFSLGLLMVFYFPVIPPLIDFLIFLVVLLGCCFLFSNYFYRKIILFFICVAVGAAWNDYLALQWLAHRLPETYIGKETLLLGTIISLPENNGLSSRFLFKTSKINQIDQQLLLQLNWQNPRPQLVVGQCWQLMTRLKPPHGLVNFNAFNRLRWFFQENIHGGGYVLNHSELLLSPGSNWFRLAVWRQNLQSEIFNSVKNPTAASIINALTIGVENGLSDRDWEVLRNTGTVHLVVIAGLHIGLVMMVIYFLVNQICRCFPALLLRYPAQQIAAITASMIALGYGALAGFGIPAQRAVIMILVLTLSQLFYFHAPVWRRILLAFLIVIIIKPGALFSAGFWLSFAAVGWIAYSISGEWRKAPHWRQWLRMQWGLFLGLMPLTLYFFQQFSLIGILANLPAILWIGWVIVPLCLVAALLNPIALTISQSVFKLSAGLLMPLWKFLNWLSEWPFACQHHELINGWILALALVGAVWVLVPKPWPARWVGLLGFAPIWLWDSPKPSANEVWLTMLDVGQGLAIVIQTANHEMVYDTGVRIPQGFDAGRDVIVPYLQKLNLKKLDRLMVSHGDNDHSGGAISLLKQWPDTLLMTSIPAMFWGYHPQFCQAGQQWQWDGVQFQVLSPHQGAEYQDNDSSCVLQISAGDQKILLTGDIEASAEQRLVDEYGGALHSKILIVPHHGSHTSSTDNFLQAVQPEYALISLGYFNRFHFPHPSVVRRYQKWNVKLFRTDQSGAIQVKLFPNQPVIIETANPHQYFWQT